MYIKRYAAETDYAIIQRFEDGRERILPKDQHDYLAWVAEGNQPTIEAAGRFLSVVDGVLVIDPDKEAILAAEATNRENNAVKSALREIDIASIRSIREWLASREDAPEFIKVHEAAAVKERAKFRE